MIYDYFYSVKADKKYSVFELYVFHYFIKRSDSNKQPHAVRICCTDISDIFVLRPMVFPLHRSNYLKRVDERIVNDEICCNINVCAISNKLVL